MSFPGAFTVWVCCSLKTVTVPMQPDSMSVDLRFETGARAFRRSRASSRAHSIRASVERF
ncbi:hypothetical protein [Microcoleus sp.]|uniref:hypothetical protein n=1 Tax=Microcoleus sp. TaxID=44472 RepID=UPI00403E6B57